MKNINEILNSLLQPASETKVFSKEKAVVPAKGFGGETSSFEDILAKMASEDADILEQDPISNSGQALTQDEDGLVSSVPSQGSFFESITSMTEIDIQITETARVDGVDAKLLEKLEHSLMSLAVGLSKLLQLVSSLQFVDPSKAQDLLVSASGGRISPKDAKALADLLSMTGKEMGSDQNPLLMTFAQQNGLLNQMFQQMIKDQQILVGQSAGSLASANGNVIQASDFFLQMTFSETDITMIRSADAQSSKVFVNLQTFQMEATFTQAGSSGVIEQSAGFHQGASFQQLSGENLATLATKLDQMFSSAGFSNLSAVRPDQTVGPSAFINQQGFFNGANQNFKNLVQLLMQTGVSQAVLTSFLNQQKDFSNSELQKSLSQNLSLDRLLQTLIPPAKILPVVSASSASELPNDIENFNPAMRTQVFIEEVAIQESISMATQVMSSNDSGRIIANQVMMETSVLQESILIEAQNNPAPSLAVKPQVASIMDIQALASINETVVRLNSFASKGYEVDVRSGLVSPTFARDSRVDQFLNSLGVNPTAPLSLLEPTANVLNSIVAPVTENNVIDVVNVSSAQLLRVALSTDQFIFSKTRTGSGTLMTQHDELNMISASALSVSMTSLKGDQSLKLAPIVLKAQGTIGPNGMGIEIEMNDPLGMSIRSKVDMSLPETLSSVNMTSVSIGENVLTSTAVGEGMKNILPTLLPGKNVDLNQAAVVNASSQIVGVKPITSQAVAPVVSNVAMNPLLDVLEDQAKNGKSLSVDLQISGSAVINGANITPDVTRVLSAQSNVANQAQINAIDSAHVLNQISDHLSRHASEIRAVSRLNFQLMPESLGRVTVQIALVDQTVSARIVVSNPDVKDTLQHHMVELKTALNQAGLQIDQLQVQVQGGSSNLLAQYFQYQREGFGYRLPASLALATVDEAKTLENSGVLGEMSIRTSLLDVLV